MNVIIINESAKKAKKLASRVLANYLPNIGRNVFSGAITSEALNILQAKLNDVSSKNTCIACFKVSTRQRLELVWIVGSKLYHDEEGNFAFKYTHQLRPKEPMTDHIKLIRQFFITQTELAALLHDLGKNFIHFQEKIKRAVDGKAGPIADPVRHEYLSYQISKSIFNLADVSSATIAEGEILEYLSNLRIKLAEIKDNSASIDLLHMHLYTAEIPELWHKKTLHVFSPSLYLILSHHKMPFKKRSLKDTYQNQSDLESEDYGSLYQLFSKQEYILQNKGILEKLDALIERIQGYFEESEKLDSKPLQNLLASPNLFMMLSHFICRPSLVLADQHFSKQVVNEPDISIYRNPVANTYRVKESTNAFNQSLVSHLQGVAKLSRTTARFLFHSSFQNDFSSLPFIETSPKKLVKKVPARLAKFQWQNSAQQAVLEKIDYIEKGGFLGFVVAKTGAGKTVANLKIMSQANNHRNFRISYLLGMRSLTLQTFDEYKAMFNFDDSAMLGIIGSALTKQIHEKNKTNELQNVPKGDELNDHANDDLSNAEALELEESETELSHKLANIDNKIPDFLKSEGRFKKTQDIISSPILISTIDYLISGMNSPKSTASKYLIRLMSSDIILDEIDNYSEIQLLSIVRMITVSAMFGNKVLISSATLSPEHVSLIKKAYQYGYEQYLKIKGLSPQNNKVFIGLFTHFEQLNRVEASDTCDIDAFFADFSRDTKNAEQKHYIAQLCLPSDHIAGAYQCILDKALELADVHSTKILCADGEAIEFSTGLIKLCNVKHIIPMALALLNNELTITKNEDTLIKFACYHSKHFDAHKSYQEFVFSQLLKRKDDKDLVNTETWKTIEKQAKAKGAKKIVFILLASPIVDTGRDFDFDFAISEFRDHRGLVQTCGRVLRHRAIRDVKHRQLGAFNPNIWMLDRSLRSYEPNSNMPPYSGPGFQNSIEYSGGSIKQTTLSLADEYKDASALELSEFESGKAVNASIFMDTSHSSEARRLELEKIACISRNEDLKPEKLFAPQNVISSEFADGLSFRDSLKREDTCLFSLHEDEIKQVNIKPKSGEYSYLTDEASLLKFDFTPFKNKDLLLVQKSLIDVMRHYKLDDGRLQKLNVPHQSNKVGINRLIFHEYLGCM
ncbi:DEAD/DEAH box helicase [Glaciecola siphonariae]|uniref:DEAD/DEAH box helicase n=1 Tax=Glaciecola siphonariae TaxID=521012 RepID=A0ABV9LYR0_9ALTE